MTAGRNRAAPAPAEVQRLRQKLAEYAMIVDLLTELPRSRTQDQAGKVLPVIITVYTDKSFDFIIKTPPAAVQLLELAKIPLD